MGCSPFGIVVVPTVIWMHLRQLLLKFKAIFEVSSSETYIFEQLMAVNNTSGIYDDVYVIHYDFAETGNVYGVLIVHMDS